MNHLIFDPITSHRAWCPMLKNNRWKKRIEQIQNILYRKSQHKRNEININHDVNRLFILKRKILH